MSERGLGGFLSGHPPNVRYLTGFTGSAGYLLAGPDAAGLVTDSRYREQAEQETAAGLSVWVAEDGWREEVARRLGSVVGEGPAGFESDHVTVRGREKLSEAAPDVEWAGADGIVEDLRQVKSAAEVERIRRAASLGDRVLGEFLDRVEEGASEADLAAELDYRLRRAGSRGVAFETIVAAGPRSALPHARPTERPVREGDLLLVDFGARVDGYCSDMTRVFCLGPAAPWQARLHGSVRRAQEAALSAVRPGAGVAEVDAAAREALDEAGLSEHFGHSTGHGLGLEVHEAPSLSGRSEAELREGEVITVEPGAYLSGRGGARLEDDVVVRPGGPERLTEFGRGLREL